MVPWEYSEWLLLNIALLYTGWRHQGHFLASHTLLSSIPGRLHKNKNGVDLCGNSCDYKDLEAVFTLSFCENINTLTIAAAVALFEGRCGNEEIAAAAAVWPCLPSCTAP